MTTSIKIEDCAPRPRVWTQEVPAGAFFQVENGNGIWYQKTDSVQEVDRLFMAVDVLSGKISWLAFHVVCTRVAKRVTIQIDGEDK